ncbi:F0F1 ATP synthase subunit C [Magnetospirillum gryphiswaldense]|jgi:F-type H+-transporting ATPase subunit c|uniref:ATP synthase subunit c n=2 Tax=Magnetospirillum gryphiswaldense TaxID=55518 RepID=V6F202_MAGGM|nr:F0F1 ATP synthase subunit C [Magnetospirillum gryphiswaldense]KAF0225900.1 MAG: F-type H+-transporting ATPase subunit [Rhodospirillaceae bacterium]TNC94839.1 MAG: F-type H+-transporting ATPase subunit c [Stygiobacter sp.]AVM74751.1 ATP synthase subunit c, sodium ion specific [Magnetospirillum gryphiswaldense MSR-1]AVM78654.1 ATP synthase subunit c, sodium ion specific [Magnetospirillum gryphiswaldense]CAM75630.1 ATP synthase C chain [Magnetospirillum gryphiswaldense MSR-1]
MEASAAKFIGAGLAAIGMIGSGIGVGNIWSSLIATVGRNPAAKANVELYGWIGFAVTEAIALFALVVALMVLFA